MKGAPGSTMKRAANSSAWAIGEERHHGFHVRRVVWGYLLASAEKREGEEIRAATIMVERRFRKRRKTLAETIITKKDFKP